MREAPALFWILALLFFDLRNVPSLNFKKLTSLELPQLFISSFRIYGYCVVTHKLKKSNMKDVDFLIIPSLPSTCYSQAHKANIAYYPKKQLVLRTKSSVNELVV